jgi:hypothetical protein
MINLKIKIPNASVMDLKDEFLPLVDWSRVIQSELLALPNSKIMYAPVNLIIQTLKTQERAQVSDEEVLAVIARTISLMGSGFSYNYNEDSKLSNFLSSFVDLEFRKKYYRQIMAMAGYKTKATEFVFITQFVADRILPIHYLDTIPYYKLSLVKLNKLHPDEIRKIVFNTMYVKHQLEYQVTMDELVIALPKEDLGKLHLPCPPPLASKKLIMLISGQHNEYFDLLESKEYVDWDELVELYHKGLVNYYGIEKAWELVLDSFSTEEIKNIEEYYEHDVEGKFNPNSFVAKEFL